MIPPTLLDEPSLETLVAQMRNPDERRGDLRAQLAAHRLAERRIEELCARRGRERVAAAMDELLAYSERVVRAGISAAARRTLRGHRRRSRPPTGCSTSASAVTVAGSEIAHRLRRHGRRSTTGTSTARSR